MKSNCVDLNIHVYSVGLKLNSLVYDNLFLITHILNEIWGILRERKINMRSNYVVRSEPLHLVAFTSSPCFTEGLCCSSSLPSAGEQRMGQLPCLWTGQGLGATAAPERRAASPRTDGAPSLTRLGVWASGNHGCFLTWHQDHQVVE